MRSKSSVKTDETATDSKPALTEEQQKQLLDQVIQKREKLAESNLEMAKIFLQGGRFNIARRRLRELVKEFDGSPAATEASSIVKKWSRNGGIVFPTHPRNDSIRPKRPRGSRSGTAHRDDQKVLEDV